MLSRRAFALSVLGLSIVTTGAACSQADEAPPVANVSLSLTSAGSDSQRASVAQGAPINLAYRFDVASDATISGDYRVFVHVTRDDGTVIWNDDHEPPPGMETSKWKPGQTIQYTRTKFVPVSSYLGEATVRIGLYRDDERLPLSGADAADRQSNERSYKVATLELLPRSTSIQVIRLSGWHPGEVAPNDPTIEWQWTQKLATLSLRNPRRDVLLYLEYDGRSDLFPGSPQQVTVSVGTTALETFAVDASGVLLRKIPISAGQLGDADMVEVRLDVDRTFIPAKLPGGSRDQRELGIRVYHAFIEPR